ncbi:cupin domain-containing protein [Aurantimonas coralicida]|uniref:cupin domain-containing protein n=1 Tax=Aurantimonas coralicida TaxID=182270 RepID=UPI00238C1623|nr:cupin domain-containing protein [Aurantimonas coralicida]MCW7545861.1 cupin domain-containing protein [Aurantimonas litoralis]MDE0925458.1 cupin domain-containing protein [Aurantimonas coralicida]
MTEHFVRFDKALVPVETGAPDKDKIRSGRPSNKTWNMEETADGLYAGIWESSAGEWDIDYEEWEFFHILEGVSVLTEDGCEPVKLVAGDSFVIRPGFKGRWKVVEPTKKHYVIKV